MSAHQERTSLVSSAWIHEDAARVAEAEFRALLEKAKAEAGDSRRVATQLAKVAQKRAEFQRTLAEAYRAIADNKEHAWLK